MATTKVFGCSSGSAESEEVVFTPSRTLARSPPRVDDSRRQSTPNVEQAAKRPLDTSSEDSPVRKKIAEPKDIYQVMSKINEVLSAQKTSTSGKAVVFDLLQRVRELYDDMKIENEKLKTENRILRETPRSNFTSYAQAAAEPRLPSKVEKVGQSSMQKKHVLFISSKVGKNSKDIQKVITEKVRPDKEKLKIKSLRTTEKTVIIETDNEQDLNKIIQHPSLKDQNLSIEKPKKRNPLVIIYDLPVDQKEDQVLESLYTQNFEDSLTREEFTNQCKVRFKTGPRNRPTVHIVAEMSANLRRLAINRGRLYVGFSSHAAKDYIVVPRCLKCQDLGHIAKHCRHTKETCSHCGEQDHKKNECGKKEQAPTCIPCMLRKKKCTSKKDCPTYKIMWDRLISKIDYGS